MKPSNVVDAARQKDRARRVRRALRDRCDHLLMLIVTPQKGDPEHFSRFLQLLDPAQFEWDEIRKIDHYALLLRDLAQ